MKIEFDTFRAECSDKEQAVKVLEEAAEMYAAWQELDCISGKYPKCDFYREDPEFQMELDIAQLDETWARKSELAEEIADIIMAACNLAERFGISVQGAMDVCVSKNRERGRYE